MNDKLTKRLAYVTKSVNKCAANREYTYDAQCLAIEESVLMVALKKKTKKSVRQSIRPHTKDVFDKFLKKYGVKL